MSENCSTIAVFTQLFEMKSYNFVVKVKRLNKSEHSMQIKMFVYIESDPHFRLCIDDYKFKL